jgi:L,D-peptidoglycan transpeptidase YkuD (ErfK/YbiS/YcfS/YnhG family)
LIKLPFSASHEALWRADNVYDVIVELGYNDDPIIPGLGSAIFMHVARPKYDSTEGCVALALEDLLTLLSQCDETAVLSVMMP